MLQNMIHTFYISLPCKKKYETSQFIFYYSFFKLDPACGFKPISERLSTQQTINLKVRKAIDHSNRLLGALCWMLPWQLALHYWTSLLLKFCMDSYAMSCFLKIQGNDIPKKKKKQTITTERNVIKLMPGENQRQQWATFLIASWLDFFQSSADTIP